MTDPVTRALLAEAGTMSEKTDDADKLSEFADALHEMVPPEVGDWEAARALAEATALLEQACKVLWRAGVTAYVRRK